MRKSASAPAAPALTSLILLAALAACGKDSTSSGGHAAMTAETPVTQNSAAGLAVTAAPAVKVTDDRGHGKAGVIVSFVVTAGGGQVTPATVTTDAQGIARVTSWVLGTGVGTNTLTASATGYASVVFSASGEAGAPSKVTLVTNDVTLLPSGTHTITPVLTDQFGNVISTQFTFQSSDAATASVTGQGLVTAQAVGEATISVSGGGKTESVRVAVAGHPGTTLAQHVALAGGPLGAAVGFGGTAYLTRHQFDVLTRFDLRNLTQGPDLSAATNPVDVAFTPDGTTALVAMQGSNDIRFVNALTNSVITSVQMPSPPTRVKVFRDGSGAFVVTNAGHLMLIDVEQRQSVGGYTIKLQDGTPVSFNGLSIHEGNDSLVFLTSPSAAQLYLVNWIEGTALVLNGIDQPQDVMLTRDGAEMWIANEAGYVAVHSVQTGQQLAKVTLPGPGFGLALSPDERQAWVTTTNGNVVVLDKASRTIVNTVAVGGTPRRVTFNRSGSVAMVSNESGWVDFFR